MMIGAIAEVALAYRRPPLLVRDTEGIHKLALSENGRKCPVLLGPEPAIHAPKAGVDVRIDWTH
jgi:hypothetical protein